MAAGSVASRMDQTREQALVASARVDVAAFAELYDWYVPRIFGFIARRVDNRDVAQDLTSMTFERALGAVRRTTFRNESFGGFLYRVAANAIVDHARRNRNTVPLGVRAGDHVDRVDDGDQARQDDSTLGDERAARAFAAALDRDVIGRALLRIPASHRQVIVMKFFDGLETDELCAALDCSRGTLAVKVHRALAALRQVMRLESTDAA